MNAEGIVSFDHGANSYFGSGHIPGQQNQEENLHARSLSASSLGNNPCGAGRKALGRVGSWTAAAATERAQPTPGELWAGMGLSSWIKGSWPLYLSMSSHWTQSGPRYSRDFNLKKKKKLFLSWEPFPERADSWGLCAGSTPSLGKYILHSGRETGVAAEHMGTLSGLKPYSLFSHRL